MDQEEEIQQSRSSSEISCNESTINIVDQISDNDFLVIDLFKKLYNQILIEINRYDEIRNFGLIKERIYKIKQAYLKDNTELSQYMNLNKFENIPSTRFSVEDFKDVIDCIISGQDKLNSAINLFIFRQEIIEEMIIKLVEAEGICHWLDKEKFNRFNEKYSEYIKLIEDKLRSLNFII